MEKLKRNAKGQSAKLQLDVLVMVRRATGWPRLSRRLHRAADRGVFRDSEMSAGTIVQEGLRTPTGPFSENSSYDEAILEQVKGSASDSRPQASCALVRRGYRRGIY